MTAVQVPPGLDFARQPEAAGPVTAQSQVSADPHMPEAAGPLDAGNLLPGEVRTIQPGPFPNPYGSPEARDHEMVRLQAEAGEKARISKIAREAAEAAVKAARSEQDRPAASYRADPPQQQPDPAQQAAPEPAPPDSEDQPLPRRARPASRKAAAK